MIPSPGTSWEVKARAHKSAASDTPFEEGQTIISRLRMTADGLVRDDFLQSEWDGDKEKASRFFWKTVYHPPQPKAEAPFKEENAAEALTGLLAENDPENTNTLFILAAMLERKRLWVEKAVQRDEQGRKVRIYEQKDGGETYFIVDPEIHLDQLVQLQEEVARKLGWIQPEENPAADSEEESGEAGGEAESPEAESEDITSVRAE